MIESIDRVTSLLRGCLDCVHNPADFGQASAALRVFDGALTSAEPLGGLNLFHDQRAAVTKKILTNIRGRVPKTMAKQIFHEAFSLELPQSITVLRSNDPILSV